MTSVERGSVMVVLGKDDEQNEPLLDEDDQAENSEARAPLAADEQLRLPWWKQSRFVIPILVVGLPFSPFVMIPLSLLCFVKLQRHVFVPVSRHFKENGARSR